MTSQLIFQIQNFLIWALMVFGITKRKDRKLHPKIMTSVIVWDVILILQIELTRSAINKAVDLSSHKTWLMPVHLFFAVGSVVLYGITAYNGRRLLKGNESARKIHGPVGWITVFFRTATMITSYFVAQH